MFSLWEQDANHLKLFANYRNTFKPVRRASRASSWHPNCGCRTPARAARPTASRFEMSARHLASGGIIYAYEPESGLVANLVVKHVGNRYMN
jgi:hypothetical protein